MKKTLDPEIRCLPSAGSAKLLLDIDPEAQVISRLTDVYERHYPEITLSFDKHYVDRYTGIDIENEQILQTLKFFGLLHPI